MFLCSQELWINTKCFGKHKNIVANYFLLWRSQRFYLSMDQKGQKFAKLNQYQAFFIKAKSKKT